jgi:pSer/pThr/pTyr-binding forkhead associated (FHA) protein
MEVELAIVDHCARESQITLYSLPAILGRDERADARIDDPWASRMHVILNWLNGTLVVRDLGSKNGVFLNGHRVAESHVLPGERLTVGLTKITVQYDRPPRPITAPPTPAPRTKRSPSLEPLPAPNADLDTQVLHR